MKLIRYFIVAALVVACEESGDTRVWVPGEDFEASISFSLAPPDNGSHYVVDEHIPITAELGWGPWKSVDSEAAGDGPVYVVKPESPDTDIASSLQWIIDPVGNASVTPVYPAGPMIPELVVTNSGKLRIHAKLDGAIAGPLESPVLEIEVKEN